MVNATCPAATLKMYEDYYRSLASGNMPRNRSFKSRRLGVVKKHSTTDAKQGSVVATTQSVKKTKTKLKNGVKKPNSRKKRQSPSGCLTGNSSNIQPWQLARRHYKGKNG